MAAHKRPWRVRDGDHRWDADAALSRLADRGDRAAGDAAAGRRAIGIRRRLWWYDLPAGNESLVFGRGCAAGVAAGRSVHARGRVADLDVRARRCAARRYAGDAGRCRRDRGRPACRARRGAGRRARPIDRGGSRPSRRRAPLDRGIRNRDRRGGRYDRAARLRSHAARVRAERDREPRGGTLRRVPAGARDRTRFAGFRCVSARVDAGVESRRRSGGRGRPDARPGSSTRSGGRRGRAA